MKKKKFACILLVLVAVLCSISPAAMAANGSSTGTAGVYATGSIRFDVQPSTLAVSRTVMPLEVGDKVVIKAGYTPFSSSVEVGIVDANDQFYYVTVTGGDVDIEITITERGNYRLAVYNLSSALISMSGYVNY